MTSSAKRGGVASIFRRDGHWRTGPAALAAALILFALCSLAFVLGLALGYLKAAPVPQLLEVRRQAEERIHGRQSAGEEVRAQAFADPIVAERLFPPATALSDVRALNDSIFVNVADFGSAYDRMRIIGATKQQVGGTHILSVGFELAGKRHHAHAYLIDPKWNASRHKRVASLIIPGTGTNMSTQMLNAAPGVAGAQLWRPAFGRADGDLFLFIKPNEDALAFHDGKRKLSNLAVNNYHLNRGGSYAASYIVQSLALTKYLQSLYPKIVVAGLSQGGAATLLNAVQSKPDVAVVASGYSAIANGLEISNFEQIVIPGYWDGFRPAALASKLGRMPSNFLFTWGLRDLPIYRLDREKALTCRFFKGKDNIACLSHSGGHEWPVGQIQSFLAAELGEQGVPAR